MDWKSRLAILTGKCSMALSRLTGRGGTSLPGHIARRIDRKLLHQLSEQARQGTILVTGTNGKTTTTKMIMDILREAHFRCVNNGSGANLIAGITTSILDEADCSGKLTADYCVFEVDEATMPLVTPETGARVVVVTNFFRDQLDRYGELDHTRDLIDNSLQTLQNAAWLVLNADDPLVASLGRDYARRIYYGVEDTGGLCKTSGAADVKYCVNCKLCPYRYTRTYYSHLGKYFCPRCGSRRPTPQVYAEMIRINGVKGSSFCLVTPEGKINIQLQVPGFYNIYNALAAASCCQAMGIKLPVIGSALSKFTAHFGRMEEVSIDGKKGLITLIKNPTGYNEALRTLSNNPQPKNIIMALNDNAADGEDVSWIWDVDFETYLGHNAPVNFIIATGLRAEDMALRLKYAGVPSSKISIHKDLGAALDTGLSKTEAGGLLNILPTYTAMLEMRESIVKRGYAKAYWQK